MKKMLPFVFAVFAVLSGCSKSSDPAAKPTASIVGTWNLVNTRTVTSPKSGAAATTNEQNTPVGAATVTYTADGKVNSVLQGVAQPVGIYTYNANTLTVTSTSASGSRSTVSIITELTDTKLVGVQYYSDSQSNYTTTSTLNR